MSHRGLLLVNLGTPQSPEPEDVGIYLKEFLMDPNVIDIPKLVRWPLVNWIIAPRRKFASSEAYKTVWTEEGSPLLVNSEKLSQAVGESLHEARVELAMRYGQPSIESGLKKLRDAGVQELSVLPLYPHFAMSSTQTVLEKVKLDLKRMSWQPKLRHLPSFFRHPQYIDVLAKNYTQLVNDGFEPDHVLMSYHGLPKRHLTKLNAGCMQEACCDTPSERSSTCYRYQAFQTTKALAAQLQLREGSFETCFQSRLGPGWIEPFTDVRIKELAESGVKRLAVFSPSFVADCLETLEELTVRGNEIFTEAGGDELKLVPSLNADPNWVKAVVDIYHGEKEWVQGL